MQVGTIALNYDEMNLYDYVMNTYDRICDLTESRVISLNYFLNNINAKYVNVALFKSVFDVTSFDRIMRLLTDKERLDELHNFGMICYEEILKQNESIIPTTESIQKILPQ